MGPGHGERLIVALFIGIAGGSLALVTGAIVLAAFGAVATMPAYGYRVGSLLAGILALLAGGLVARWAYRRPER